MHSFAVALPASLSAATPRGRMSWRATRQTRVQRVIARAAHPFNRDNEEFLSNEWNQTWSLQSYDDVQGYMKKQASAKSDGRNEPKEAETDGIISGEWPANWSLASYDDLSQFFYNKYGKKTRDGPM